MIEIPKWIFIWGSPHTIVPNRCRSDSNYQVPVHNSLSDLWGSRQQPGAQIPLVERDFPSFAPSFLYLCLWASMSCRRGETLAIGYCGFHGSYKDYFGRQLTLVGNFDLYFLMSFAQCTTIFIFLLLLQLWGFPLLFWWEYFQPSNKVMSVLKESHWKVLI